jgi:arylsulfatase A-like enzyme
MAGRRAIVIAVDGLRASALGAYGNSWYATPALDALAAESLVFDWMWCDSPELAGFYRGAWGDGAELLRWLAAAGGDATLITDDPDFAQSSASAFHETVRTDGSSSVAARDVAETAAARTLALAAQRLNLWTELQDVARLMWVHVNGFRGPWDAPLELRAALLDEGDPPAPTFTTPPELLSSENHDELLAYRAAYGAQAVVIDQCVGGLLEAIDELGLDRDVLTLVVGCRGYALGEHGFVGGACTNLYGELLHVPCMVRRARRASAPRRCGGLAHPSDLAAMLARWFELPQVASDEQEASPWDDETDSLAPRRMVVSGGPGGERVLRTPAWLLRLPAAGNNADVGSPRHAELYVKPDDRWEANEVADRCPDVVERLLAVLDQSTPGLRVAPADWDGDLLGAAS